MSEEENYIESTNFWIASQKNMIEQIKLNIENSQNTVKLHQEALINLRAQLMHEQTNYSDTREAFSDWLIENGYKDDISNKC